MARDHQELPSDAELAGQVLRQGDEVAFRTLYRRHTPALFQFVLRLLGGAQGDAEDVVQETWICAVSGLGRFRWDASLRTWLFGIGRNRARRHLRRGGGVTLEALDGVEPEAPPAEVARIDLEQGIRLLPEGYRAVLVLHDIEGFTHEEIGQCLRITPGTSRSQLHFARRTLRRLIGKAGGHIDERQLRQRVDG
jgi:RNA polymerase sigma-70 factor, ECF subfamily